MSGDRRDLDMRMVVAPRDRDFRIGRHGEIASLALEWTSACASRHRRHLIPMDVPGREIEHQAMVLLINPCCPDA